MLKKGLRVLVVLAAGFGAGFAARGMAPLEPVVHAQAGERVFELRTYTTAEGKLGNLHARFRNHTMKFFEKHGMTNVAYLSPQDAPLVQNTLVYLLAHQSRETAKKSWDGMRADEAWRKAAAESGVGPLVKVESVFLSPTDYSPLK